MFQKLSAARTQHRINGQTTAYVRGWMRSLAASKRRHGIVALADQALVSGINFVTTVVIARQLAPTQYGYYALLCTALLFANGIQSALITGPLMVLAPRQDALVYPRYVRSLWLLQLGGAVLVGTLLAATLLLGHARWPQLRASIGVLPLTLVMVGYLCQEFVRRVLFCAGDSWGGIVVDLLNYGVQIVALAVLLWYGTTLNAVLWVIGSTSLLSCVYGVVRAGLRGDATRADLGNTWRQHWVYGRWLASSNLANWTGSQLYAVIVAALLSPAAAGLYIAGRNLLGCTHILLLGLENVVPSMMTRRLLHGGVEALDAWARRFRVLSGLLVSAYCLGVALFAAPLIRLLFGAQYHAAGVVVPVLAAGYALIAWNRPTMFALRALGQPRWSFYANLVAAIATLVAAVPLITRYGILGAAIGTLLTHAIVLLIARFGYERELRSLRLLASQEAAYG